MIFWKLFLAHLLTDFVFQPDSIAREKTKPKVLLLHCLIFFLLSMLLFLPSFSIQIVWALCALSAFHGVIDHIKLLLDKGHRPLSWVLFLMDQLLHLLGIGATIFLLDRGFFSPVIEKAARYWLNPSTFLVLSFFVLIIFGSSFFIVIVCKGFEKSLDSTHRPEILKAGRYIGILERSLLLIAVLMNRPELVGYLFAAKSIVRYPEMKREANFAEYYLIGTLTSISIAFFGGLLLKHLLGW